MINKGYVFKKNLFSDHLSKKDNHRRKAIFVDPGYIAIIGVVAVTFTKPDVFRVAFFKIGSNIPFSGYKEYFAG
jgi:hypothetical protein